MSADESAKSDAKEAGQGQSEAGEPNAPAQSERGSDRMWARRILFAFVAFQLIVPLTYYLRDDPYDERFAWRMFSAIRLHRCETSASETTDAGESAVELDMVIHRAWRNTMSRNRRDVIHRFLEHRCKEEGNQSVTVRNSCRTPGGASLEAQVYTRDCESGDVSEPAESIIVSGDEQ